MNYKILVVDDELSNIRLLERIFSPHYDVVKASSGPEGLDMLARHDVSLILSDQRMPGMTGIEFLQKAAEIRPQCVRIILTGYADSGSLIDAINSGVVYKYVTKPWVNSDLLQTVKRGLSHFETLRAQNQLNTVNIRLRQRIDDTNAVLVRVLMALMSATDPEAETRAIEIRNFAQRIGRRMLMDAAQLNQLGLAAYLSEAADFRVEALDPGAARSLKDTVEPEKQTVLSVLSELPDLEEIVQSISDVDEHYNGSGNFGRAGDAIPLYSRIISVARAFQHMTVDGVSTDEAIEAIRGEAGALFDPEVIEAFIGNGVDAPAGRVHTSREMGIRVP